MDHMLIATNWYFIHECAAVKINPYKILSNAKVANNVNRHEAIKQRFSLLLIAVQANSPPTFLIRIFRDTNGIESWETELDFIWNSGSIFLFSIQNCEQTETRLQLLRFFFFSVRFPSFQGVRPICFCFVFFQIYFIITLHPFSKITELCRMARRRIKLVYI